MMTRRRTLLKSVAALVALCCVAPATAQESEPTPVVATFSILGDMVERIGEEHVNVMTLVGPGADAHVYQPTPADARTVQEADVMIVNGLEFEGWIDRLAEAAAFDGSLVVATNGVIALEDETGAVDPHAWLNMENAVIYVDNITAALSKADPANATTFYSNRATYVEEIEALDADIRSMMEALPEDGRTIVTTHDAFQYFASEYGLTFLATQGISTESEASAQDFARLIAQIRADAITAMFVENAADPRLLQQIANETGATIGGTLYPEALSDADGPAATYLDLMRHNATSLSTALTP